MTKNVNLDLTDHFEVLFNPHHPDFNKRYITFYGGRGGMKSWQVARALLFRGTQKKLLILCTREHQNSIADSVKSLLEGQAREMGLASFYEFQEKKIKGKNGTEFIFKGLKHNIGSVKSFEGVDIVWNEEAEATSQRSIDVVYPTIRKAGSQIITTFNPRSSTDPIYLETITNFDPSDCFLKKVTYLDNPWIDQAFVDRANKLKLSDIEAYNHIYLGDLDNRHTGAVYAKWLHKAEEQGRICSVPYDPSCEVFTAWDLGWADSTTIWFLQFVGRELRWIDYYENNQEDIKHYVDIVKSKGYNYAIKGHYLPHDGAHNNIRGASIESQLKQMGLSVTILEREPSLGAGIDLLRNTIDFSVFDKARCHDGLHALKQHVYAWDDDRQIYSSKPYHDWTSHAADSARYAAIAASMRKAGLNKNRVAPMIKKPVSRSRLGS